MREMETKQIISWLRDKAARAHELSHTRMLNLAADRLNELTTELEEERHRHDRYVDFELAESAELEKLKEAHKWIPVTERMPVLHTDDYEEPDGSRMQFEVSEDQWVITASGIQTKARYETGVVFQGWVGDFGETVQDVTHWMPLPEPPKEVE